MSTRLTKKSNPMVDSEALKLVLSASHVQELTTRYLSQTLNAKGYEAVTPSILNFLSALECGVNYGSEIARSLGVSRQMVAKTVKELCRYGYLEQKDGMGKQKEILFTHNGELLMSDTRKILADIDKILVRNMGLKSVQSTIANLATIAGILAKLDVD